MREPALAHTQLLVGDDVELLVEILRERKLEVPIAMLARAALDGHGHVLVERLADDLAAIDDADDQLRELLPLLDAHYAQWVAALDQEGPLALANESGEFVQERLFARSELERLRTQLRRLMR